MSPSLDAARRGRLTAALGLFVTTLCWGSTVPITAELLKSIDPLLVAPARYAIATPILLLFSWIVDRGKPWPHYLPWLRTAILGGSVALFVTLVAYGIYYSDPVTAVAIFATSPVVALAMSWLADRRPLPAIHLVAVALAVAGGIMAAVFKPGSELRLGFRGGELMLLAGMVCWIWYSMKAQTWLAPLGFTQIRLTFVSSFAALIWLVIVYIAGVALGLAAPPPASPTAVSIVELVWMAFGPTALGVALWNYGNAIMGVAVSMLYVNLSPIVGVVISVLLFGADTTLMQMVGGFLVVAGVGVIQIHSLRAGAAPKAPTGGG